jgi:hypothetical protein
MKKGKRKVLYFVILAILILLIAFFSLRAYNRYNTWKDHSDWKDSEDKKIEGWMTVNLVLNYFEIDREELFAKLNIPDGWNSKRRTIEEIAEEKNFPIDEMLDELNSLI